MIEFLYDYGLFLAKTATLVAALLIIIAGSVAATARTQHRARDRIDVQNLNRHYRHLAQALENAMLPKGALKQVLKRRKKQDKADEKEDGEPRKRLFVLNFQGDIRASAVAALREEVTAVLTVARAQDEVLLRLESAGGLVHAYGLAASQLQRLRDRQIKLTVAVDKVAASGGYMMACVAERIIAAPFAVVGSIGVVAQLPNLHRLLEKHDIDYEQFTAGEYKRTVTMFGEITDKARDKFREEIEDTHALFKDFVKTYRQDLDIAQVATGEHWYGARALALRLIDELRTSDDYLLAASAEADLYEITYNARRPLLARWLSPVTERLDGPDIRFQASGGRPVPMIFSASAAKSAGSSSSSAS